MAGRLGMARLRWEEGLATHAAIKFTVQLAPGAAVAFRKALGAFAWVKRRYAWVMRTGGIMMIVTGLLLVTVAADSAADGRRVTHVRSRYVFGGGQGERGRRERERRSGGGEQGRGAAGDHQ